MDLIYFLNVLYRRKWIILGLSFLAVLAALAIKWNKKPLYESVAQYSTGFTAEKVRLTDGTAAVDLFGADVKFNNVIETFKSPRVVSRLSYRLLLHDLQNPNTAYRKLNDKQRKDPLLKEIHKDTVISILMAKIASGDMLHTEVNNERLVLEYLKLYEYDHYSILQFMNIRRVDRTDYLDIVFWSENPELSAWVVNTMGDEFLNFYRGLNTQRSEENALSIQAMLDLQQRKVDSMGQTLLNEKLTQGTIDPVSRSTSAMETVREIETQLAAEKSKRNVHQNRINYLNERIRNLESASSGSGDDVITLTNRRNTLMAELQRRGGTDAALQKEIDEVRAEIVRKSGSGSSKKRNQEIADLKNQVNEENALLRAAETTIADYEASIRRYMGLTNVNPGSSVKMDVLRDQLEIENNQLKTIKEKYNQVQGLVKDDPTSNFIQTRIGQPAIDPEPKRTMLTMMLSGVSMFFLTSVIFLFIEIFDSSVKTPTIFKKQVKVKMNNVMNKVNFRKMAVADVILQELDEKKHKGENIFKNNVRKLRHDLMDSGKNIFLVTSTHKKAGKSTILEALAASLLLSRKKVLLIDLNFTNNSLTHRFDCTQYIQDIAEKVDYARPFEQQNLVGKTPYEDLDILGCKEGNFTPSEALFNVDMNKLLELFRSHYDYILIEGAALNYFADSKELSHYTEGVITVFSAEDAVTHADNESLRFVGNLGDKNQGIVLNEVRTENINS